MEGLLSTGPTPSSFTSIKQTIQKYYRQVCRLYTFCFSHRNVPKKFKRCIALHTEKIFKAFLFYLFTIAFPASRFRFYFSVTVWVVTKETLIDWITGHQRFLSYKHTRLDWIDKGSRDYVKRILKSFFPRKAHFLCVWHFCHFSKLILKDIAYMLQFISGGAHLNKKWKIRRHSNKFLCLI